MPARLPGGAVLARIGVTGLLAAGFLVVACGALLLPSQRPLSLVALASAVAAYAVASRVEVEFPGFVAIPTEAIKDKAIVKCLEEAGLNAKQK